MANQRNKLAPIQSAGDIHVMTNLLSDVGFKRNWVKGMKTLEEVEEKIFKLVDSYGGSKEERLRVFHLIQIWGGYSGRNIYLNHKDGFSWDRIDPHYVKLIEVCKDITDVNEASINKVFEAISVFNGSCKYLGVAFITKHTRFWLYKKNSDIMLPIYDSIMAKNYYHKNRVKIDDVLGYWKKICSDKNKGTRTLCQYERDLYNQYRPKKNKQFEGENKPGYGEIVRNLDAGEEINARIVSYGEELDIQGKSYFLFIGEKKTFTYCDFLYKGNIQTLPKESSLIENGFERRTTKRDCYLVYKFPKRTVVSKSEGEALLVKVKEILFKK